MGLLTRSAQPVDGEVARMRAPRDGDGAAEAFEEPASEDPPGRPPRLVPVTHPRR
jgi:hypothetical protein